MSVQLLLFPSHPVGCGKREKTELYKHLIRCVTVMLFVVKSDDGKGSCVELDFLIWSEQKSTAG